MRKVISCSEFQLKFDSEYFLYISLGAEANGWYYCLIFLCRPLWTTSITQSSVPVASLEEDDSKREWVYAGNQK